MGKTRKRFAKKPNPPSAAGMARMSSGIVMTGGDRAPWAADSLRGDPKNVTTTRRVM